MALRVSEVNTVTTMMMIDPSRMIGRRATVSTESTMVQGLICSAGLGGVVIQDGMTSHRLNPCDIISVVPSAPSGNH